MQTHIHEFTDTQARTQRKTTPPGNTLGGGVAQGGEGTNRRERAGKTEHEPADVGSKGEEGREPTNNTGSPYAEARHGTTPPGNTAEEARRTAMPQGSAREGEEKPNTPTAMAERAEAPAKRRVRWQDDLTATTDGQPSACDAATYAQRDTHLRPPRKRTHAEPEEIYGPEKRGEQTVRALVSNIGQLQTGMLQKDVAIGATVATAHLDTCATHCFLSHRASKVAIAQGYPAYNSKVRYRVEQGNPLCVATQVHVLPLAIIRNDGTAAFWEAVLFIIADCGADIIVGYPTLKLGGIIDYDPPLRYENVLSDIARSVPPPSYTDQAAQAVLARGRVLSAGPQHLRNRPSDRHFLQSTENQFKKDRCRSSRHRRQSR